MFLVKKFILQYIMKTHFDFIKYNENHNVWGSQCCGWVGEAREGGWRGGLYYIKIFFFFKRDYYILYNTKKKEGDICEFYIILYNTKKKKKTKKTREGVVGGFILYENITCLFFFQMQGSFTKFYWK